MSRSYFTKANLVLEQYQHIPSFGKIRAESEQIMRGFKNTLRLVSSRARACVFVCAALLTSRPLCAVCPRVGQEDARADGEVCAAHAAG